MKGEVGAEGTATLIIGVFLIMIGVGVLVWGAVMNGGQLQWIGPEGVIGIPGLFFLFGVLVVIFGEERGYDSEASLVIKTGGKRQRYR